MSLNISKNTIKLQTDSILQVPFFKYDKNFTFIINSKKYETSSICADLLSPIISSYHLIDPTINEYVINTVNKGDFDHVISLTNFEAHKINDDDYPFILEFFEKLGTEKVSITNETSSIKLTNDNVFECLNNHKKCQKIFEKDFENEIDYISSHFCELKDKLAKMIKDEKIELDDRIIERILKNDNLLLDSEDELLDFVNELYSQNRNFSRFYEFVSFKNVECESMKRFISIFDMNDLTNSMWISLIDRLEQPILTQKTNSEKVEQTDFLIEIENKENQFDGILYYFNTKCDIKNEVKITSSSRYSGNPFNLIKYDDLNTAYSTNNEENSWICFEFINHKIFISDYIIRSYFEESNDHLRTWVFEGSNDNKEWVILDEERNNQALNGSNRVHNFHISNMANQPFKYLRIRQTGLTWSNFNYLLMNSIEFYGKII